MLGLWMLLLTDLGVMADVDTFYQKQSVLGNVGGMVGDPLQIVGNEHQVHGGLDRSIFFLHEINQFIGSRVPEAIDLVVGDEDTASQSFVALYQGVETFADH